MLTRKLVIPSLVALIVVTGTTAVSLAASLHGGMLGSAAPENIVPATADLFVSIDRGDTQGPALAQVWNTYRNHPGAAAALAHLGANVNQVGQALHTLSTILAPFGDRAGLALWAPASGPNGAYAPLTSNVQPSFAIIAQLKMPNLLGGQMPLSGLATLTPASTYRGIQIYTITFKHGTGSGYACVVSGDGVLTSDMKTVMKVIDTATYQAPALATDPSFATAVASLPAPRLLTVYVGPRFLTFAQRFSSLLSQPRRSVQFGPTVPASLMHATALAVVATPDGFGVTTSALPEPASALHIDPNAAAGVLASNAILYTSQDNLAATLAASGLLSGTTGKQLATFEQQTGVNVQRDLLSWMNGEYALNLNTSVSPVVGLLLASTRTGSVSAPTLLTPPAVPGSLELTWHVDDPAMVQQSLNRVFAALLHALNKSSTGALSTTIRFNTTTLPDGTQVHLLSALPGVGYAFRGHWLILSTNVMNDASGLAALTTNQDYAAALARVAGTGPTLNVSYLDVSRLLAVVDKWIAFTSMPAKTGAGAAPLAGHAGLGAAPLRYSHISLSAAQAASPLLKTAVPLLHHVISMAISVDNTMQHGILKQSAPTLSWRQVEPLIAPLHSLVSVTRLVGTSDAQLQAFLTVR